MNKGTIPDAGDYTARLNAKMVVEAKESGSLILWVPYALTNSEIKHTGKFCFTIGQKDGTINQRGLQDLKKIFPEWDGDDIFALENIEPNEDGAAQFELAQCFHDNSYTPDGATEPVWQLKAKWMNPLGGTTKMPEPMDAAGRKSVLAAWGGKIRASLGGKAAPKPAAATKSAAPAKAPAAPPKSAAGGPPSRRTVGGQARTATQQEVWEALANANGGAEADVDALGTQFWEAAEEVAPNSNGDLTPAQWGAVAEKLGV